MLDRGGLARSLPCVVRARHPCAIGRRCSAHPDVDLARTDLLGFVEAEALSRHEGDHHADPSASPSAIADVWNPIGRRERLCCGAQLQEFR
jgi:hypothetical protein